MINNPLVCQICQKETKRIGMHVLRAHQMSHKDYYDQFLKQENEGICPVCGQLTSFININQGYHKYCSYKCSSSSEEVKSKTKSTILQRYGAENYANREKAAQTTLQRYGRSNYRNTEKSRQTCLERYGVEYTFQAQEFRNKSKQTIEEKYGVEFVTQSPLVKEKIRNTSIERYGGTGNQVLEFREKQKQTCKELYGDEFYRNNEKSKQTKLLRFGDENYNNREQSAITCLSKYGVVNPAQTKEVQRKGSLTRKRTSISNDGTSLDSGWEKMFYDFCLNNNLSIERNVPINFLLNGKEKVTFIDFKVEGILFEVKASHLLKGCFDNAFEVKIEHKINLYIENNVHIITDYKELFLNNPLLGFDVDLFNPNKNEFLQESNSKSLWDFMCQFLSCKNYFVSLQMFNSFIRGGDYLL